MNIACHLRSRFSAPGESCHTGEEPQGSPAQQRLLVLGPHRKSRLCPGVVPPEQGKDAFLEEGAELRKAPNGNVVPK